VSDLHLETRLNGKVMQSTSNSDLLFDVPKLIEYFSQFYKLMPSDVISTGSPSGVDYGARHSPLATVWQGGPRPEDETYEAAGIHRLARRRGRRMAARRARATA
jgi:2-keto-4-pentenoate hydratase/2-oxohepta-3-ene-1,7-dioic acid hydratase in catechol pathway